MVKEPNSVKTAPNYFIQLDGLRCVAIMMVLLAHWAQWKSNSTIFKAIPFSHGVTLFFVLSGFLITRILLQGRDEGAGKKPALFFKAFYLRRILRIFPIYYLLIFSLLITGYKDTRELFPWLVTYTTNIYQAVTKNFIGDFNHFWSLAAEEQFYLFWPLIVLLLPARRTLASIAIMIGTSIAFRIAIFLYSANWMAIDYSTPGCMHALGIGSLAAYLYVYHLDAVRTHVTGTRIFMAVMVYCSLLYITINHGPYWYKDLFDEVVFAVVSAMAVLLATTHGFSGIVKSLLENSWVVKTGKISYGIYVYHLFIPSLAYWLLPKLGLHTGNGVVLFLVFLVMTWIAAWASWKFIESPINNLKNRIPYIRG